MQVIHRPHTTEASKDVQASDLSELACDVCPLCRAGAAVAFLNGAYTHFPEPCKSATIWEEIHTLLLGRVN